MTQMALNIKNPETDQLAHELAQETGETITEAVTAALKHRLSAIRRKRERAHVRIVVAELQAFVASLPDRDYRSAEEIIGYGDFGLPA
jgi:antitoxin VapB